MSTLQQSLNQRRAAELPLQCITVASAPTPALTIRSWGGETWVLPWSHLVSARLGNDAGQLEITFTNCVLIVTGENLRGLVEELATFRIGCLRDLPAAYRKKTAENEPFINRLEMRQSRESS